MRMLTAAALVLAAGAGVAAASARAGEYSLKPLSKAEQKRLAEDAGPRLRVGVERKLPGRARGRGQWLKLADGAEVWRLTIRSPGARAVRLRVEAFRVGEGRLTVGEEFGGGGGAGRTYTGAGPDGSGAFWTDVVFADRVALEYRPAPGERRGGVPFRLPRLSHIAR